MLASVYVYSGFHTLRNPAAVAPAAEAVIGKISEKVSPALANTEQAVRVNSAVQLVAGSLLAAGRLPRLSAFALACSLVPTTLAGHRFWKCEDPEERARQQSHFLKNLSMLGGLLVAAADTGGRPSLCWRARYTAGTARREAALVRRTAKFSAPCAKVVGKGLSLPRR